MQCCQITIKIGIIKIHNGVRTSCYWNSVWCEGRASASGPHRRTRRAAPPPVHPAARRGGSQFSALRGATATTRLLRRALIPRNVVKCTRASWHSADTVLDASCMTTAHTLPWRVTHRLQHGLRQGTLHRWEDLHLHQHCLRGQYSHNVTTILIELAINRR